MSLFIYHSHVKHTHIKYYCIYSYTFWFKCNHTNICWPHVYLLCESVYAVHLKFFLLFLLFLIHLDINLLSDIRFASIFSHCLGYVFILLFPLLCSFVLWCNPTGLFLLLLLKLFDIISKKSLPRPLSWSFSCMLYSRSFTVQVFNLSELIFAYGVK